MNNPTNVPPLTDARFIAWDTQRCSPNQIVMLSELLHLEGINPAELYGDGFSSIADLSRWAASWGIGLLESRQQARWVEHERQRIEHVRESQLKRFIADYYREQRHVERS